jgi:hypothetical protein
MRKRKAAEPQILEHSLLSTEKSLIETIDVISNDEYQSLDRWEEEYYEKIGALNERAEKPTFPMEVHSAEFKAIRKEVSELARNGQIYLRVAYLKYLSAIGFSIDDANLLVDNIEGPCRSNIFEKVRHAEWALDMATMDFI